MWRIPGVKMIEWLVQLQTPVASGLVLKVFLKITGMNLLLF